MDKQLAQNRNVKINLGRTKKERVRSIWDGGSIR